MIKPDPLVVAPQDLSVDELESISAHFNELIMQKRLADLMERTSRASAQAALDCVSLIDGLYRKETDRARRSAFSDAAAAILAAYGEEQ